MTEDEYNGRHQQIEAHIKLLEQIDGQNITYHPGDVVEVRISKTTIAIFTFDEWTRAIKRGKPVLKNRQAKIIT